MANRNHQRWPRSAGRKPNSREMSMVRQYGLALPGTQNALVAAMILRAEGASQPQIIAATGRPHRNKIKQLRDNPHLHIKVRQRGRIKVHCGRVH